MWGRPAAAQADGSLAGGVGVVDEDGVDVVDVGEGGGELVDRLPPVDLVGRFSGTVCLTRLASNLAGVRS